MSRTILMIHGVGSSADAFSKLAPAFRERGWKVVAPTLRDELRPHENPPAELTKVSLADYVSDAADIARKIAKEDGAPPVVFGHSMGGMITQKLAEMGLAAGAVLITPASPAGARAGRALAQAFTFANILFAGKPENRSHRIWKQGFTWGVLNRVPKSKHEALWKQNRYDSGRVLADLAYPDEDPSRTCHVDESKVKVPVLVIGGALDRTTPIADVRLCAEKYRKVGGEYREYAKNAHWIVDEPGTDKVIADIAEWMDRKGLTAGAAKPAAAAKAVAKAPAKPKPAAKPVAAPKAVAKAPAKAKATPKPVAKKAAPAPAPAKAVKPKAVAKPNTAPAKAAAKPKAAPKAVAPAKPVAKKAAPKKVAAKPKAKKG